MSSKLRQRVPIYWVLLGLVTFSVIFNHLETQFWQADPLFSQVVTNYSNRVETWCDLSVGQCTVLKLSCESDGRMSGLTVEQKKIL